MHKDTAIYCKSRLIAMIIRLLAVFLLFLIPNGIVEYLIEDMNRESYKYALLVIAISFILAMIAFAWVSFALVEKDIEKGLMAKRTLLRSIVSILVACVLVFEVLYLGNRFQPTILGSAYKLLFFSTITQAFFVAVESTRKGGVEALIYVISCFVVGTVATCGVISALTSILLKESTSKWELAIGNAFLWLISFLICEILTFIFDAITEKVWGGRKNEA